MSRSRQCSNGRASSAVRTRGSTRCCSIPHALVSKRCRRVHFWRRCSRTTEVHGRVLVPTLEAFLDAQGRPKEAAQQAAKVPRIGFLSPSSPSDLRTRRFVEAFRQGLRELGWLEGQNITIEYRWAAEEPERLAALARQLVSLRVAVIVAATTPAIMRAKQASSTIPVVMAVAAEPVATGIVANIARPGGNVTGLSMMAPELLGKKMQLIQELVPNISRVAILWNPSNPSNVPQIRYAADAAQAMHIKVELLEARGKHSRSLSASRHLRGQDSERRQAG